ncbi:TonB-dependent receptor, partial [Candidatus Albibeggiatoa sp. nov. NOAA]|uniref:TonB-dependent receptor plug domain-containing protein n=1 Tax=Candidatus Albibeggiatoa sp. nov. NOAA TaxID=3162724 RepID=UPI0032F5FB2A|nr:TonB-dependent receptor [Thiotrichaceae bacterium]
MNEHTHFGVISERDLSMLGDIQHIDVVRGSGSAIHGAGAVSMVISIETENALSFEGTEVIAKAGAIDEFYSLELKHGKKLSEDSGYFVYLGVDKYVGADQHDAPYVLGTSYTDFWGNAVAGQQAYSQYAINRDGAAWRDKPRVKLHTEYTHNALTLWMRYTRGGQQYVTDPNSTARWPYGWLDDWAVDNYPSYESFEQPGAGYQQLTLLSQYKQQISDTFSIDYTLSYDLTDYERGDFSSQLENWTLNHREDEILAKATAHWQLNEQHYIAFGAAWSREWFGKNSIGFPDDSQAVLSPWVQPPYNGDSPEWSTNTYSLLAEHQWQFTPNWTLFYGGRVDKNDNTDLLYSPRAAFIYTPNEQDTWKLMYSKSLRMTFAEERQWTFEHTGDKSEPEELKSLELRYERQHSSQLFWAASAYYHDLDLISWDSGEFGVDFDAGTRAIGDLTQTGLELELAYHSEPIKINLSHAYHKLLDFTLLPDTNTALTAKPYGYGDELAVWSSHISKLTGSYLFNPRWKIDGSARIYWGFDGAKAFSDYNNANNTPYNRNPDNDDPYGASIFVNLGIQHQLNDNIKLRLDAYNILGWIDDTYNKRLFGFNAYGDYRAHAPALAATLRWQF